MVFKTNYRLMQIKSIAECCKRALRKVLLYSLSLVHFLFSEFVDVVGIRPKNCKSSGTSDFSDPNKLHQMTLGTG